MNILNLRDWNVLSLAEAEHDYRITAEYLIEPKFCQKCGCFTDLNRHGFRPQLYMDLTMHEKRVGILVQRRRYHCKRCDGTFLQDLPDMHDDHLMTKRLVAYIETESIRRTFADLADRFGIDERSVRRIFQVYVKRLEAERCIAAPQWLGIDEAHLTNEYRAVFTDLKQVQILDVLKTRSQKVVERYLMTLPGHDSVEVAVIDMWRPYRDALAATCPQAAVVVDKFHLVRMASDALEVVRKQTHQELTDQQRKVLKHDRYVMLRRKRDLEPKYTIVLDYWIRNFPLLGQAYDLKERFYDNWELTDRNKAEGGYADWKDDIPRELAEAFSPLTTAVNNWYGEIFNYFDWQATNAYTEAANGLIKMANRAGRGYSFDVLRAKMIYSHLSDRTRSRYIRDPDAYYIVGHHAVTYRPMANWEIEIYTLAEQLEAGDDPLTTTT